MCQPHCGSPLRGTMYWKSVSIARSVEELWPSDSCPWGAHNQGRRYALDRQVAMHKREESETARIHIAWRVPALRQRLLHATNHPSSDVSQGGGSARLARSWPGGSKQIDLASKGDNPLCQIRQNLVIGEREPRRGIALLRFCMPVTTPACILAKRDAEPPSVLSGVRVADAGEILGPSPLAIPAVEFSPLVNYDT